VNRKIVLLTMGTMLCSASAAMADPIGDPFRACGKIAEDKARLACFDEALQSLDQRQAVVQQTQKEQAEAEYGLKKFETSKQAETELPKFSFKTSMAGTLLFSKMGRCGGRLRSAVSAVHYGPAWRSRSAKARSADIA